MRLNAGDTLDRYTLRRRLGAGGQAAVWLADDPLEPGVPKAIKVVPVAGTAATDLERMRREARALAQLSHPSLARCFALVEDPRGGHLGLVMDFVDGESLLELFGDPRMDLERREAVLRHTAAVLAYVHREGIVHRDLKLSNILVSRRFWEAPGEPSNVKVVDFGIAVARGNPQPLTQIGAVVGTLAFMPPELVAPGYFDALGAAPAGDVFAFGVVGWLLLAGGYPSGAGGGSLEDYAGLYRAVVDKRAPWPVRPLDHKWADLLRQCLSLDAEHRPTSSEIELALCGGPLEDATREMAAVWLASAAGGTAGGGRGDTAAAVDDDARAQVTPRQLDHDSAHTLEYARAPGESEAPTAPAGHASAEPDGSGQEPGVVGGAACSPTKVVGSGGAAVTSRPEAEVEAVPAESQPPETASEPTKVRRGPEEPTFRGDDADAAPTARRRRKPLPKTLTATEPAGAAEEQGRRRRGKPVDETLSATIEDRSLEGKAGALGSGRRRSIAIAASVVALAVLAAVLGLLASGC
ncbi:MAG: protein kinase [Deltaproteobacteria bacterium]|nr:protein kinase [Deltaproteobacteria bacterium]